MNKTEDKIDELESLLPDDDNIDHGICGVCHPHPELEEKIFAFCGEDISDDTSFIPQEECTNVCKECLKLGFIHGLQHTLGKI